MFDLFGSLSSTMGVDLGTANTLIYTKENGIIVREPSLVARHKKTGRILAVGSEAKQMEGRTPDFLETLHPLRDGVIADFDVTAAMLRIFLKKHFVGVNLFSPRLLSAFPAVSQPWNAGLSSTRQLKPARGTLILLRNPLLLHWGLICPSGKRRETW